MILYIYNDDDDDDYDEQESPSEVACLRYITSRNRQMRGRTQDI